MSSLPKFSIDLNEEFPSLKSAPSIEAVIHWQADASTTFEPTVLQEELIQRLPDYPICQPQQGIEISAETTEGNSEFRQRTKWNGFRLQDEHKHHVAQFTQHGVVFSRLQPYERWENFKTEAIRFWELFLELAAPTVIQRLGVRYINRVPLEDNDQPSTYLKVAPYPLPELDFSPELFFYKDVYKVPDHPYSIQWTRTIQPQRAVNGDKRALIIDIDVFTTELLELDQETLIQRLSEMRWLKNKVFFSCITEAARERFGA